MKKLEKMEFKQPAQIYTSSHFGSQIFYLVLCDFRVKCLNTECNPVIKGKTTSLLFNTKILLFKYQVKMEF